MDITAFDSVYQSFRRNEAKDLLRDSMIRAYAANDPGGLTKYMERWVALLNDTFNDDEDKFARDLGGKGF